MKTEIEFAPTDESDTTRMQDNRQFMSAEMVLKRAMEFAKKDKTATMARNGKPKVSTKHIMLAKAHLNAQHGVVMESTKLMSFAEFCKND